MRAPQRGRWRSQVSMAGRRDGDSIYLAPGRRNKGLLYAYTSEVKTPRIPKLLGKQTRVRGICFIWQNGVQSP